MLGLVGGISLSGANPAGGALWTFLEIAAAGAVLVTGIMFLYKDLALWWVETTIISNKRVFSWRGLARPTRQEIPLENVQQVALGQRSLLSLLLDYGDVRLYLVGSGELRMERIAHPKKLMDALEQITVQAREGKAAAPKPQISPYLDWRQALAHLARGHDF